MPRESSFAAYRPTTLPPSINGPFARLLTSTFGVMQDEELELLEVAVKARLPRYCPDDGLDKLGEAYQVERYVGESHDSYRARIVAAWLTWEEAGSVAAVERQIRAAFACDVRVQRDEEGNFWGPSRWYSRFRVRIGPDLGSLTFTAGHIAATQRRTIKAIAIRWMAAHGYAGDIMVHVSGSVIGEFVIGEGTIGGVSEQIYIGRMINQNMTIGSTPIGGYDRS